MAKVCMHDIDIEGSCFECNTIVASTFTKDFNVQRLYIRNMVEESYGNATEKGFHETGFQTFGDVLMLMVSELSEALEEYRKGCPFDKIYFVLDKDGRPKPEGIPVEIADCLIRLLDNTGFYGLPIESAYVMKSDYNKTREYRHGGKRL